MAEFTLYHYPFPSRADRVLWTLKELGFDYDTRVVDPFKGEHQQADYLAINPTAKVPTLLHRGKSYTESLAIIQYLNTLHPEQPLMPKDADACYQVQQAMSYGATEVEAYAWLIMQATKFNKIYQWPDGTAQHAIKPLHKAMPIVWGWLSERDYVAGASFSLADIYYYGLIRWVNRLGVPLPEHVEGYLSRLEQRPNFHQVA